MSGRRAGQPSAVPQLLAAFFRRGTRTTRTGQSACARTPCEVDPRSVAAKPLRPREPMTIWSAVWVAATRTSVAGASQIVQRTSRSGNSSRRVAEASSNPAAASS
ncbi:Uncharacterised protein [Mycobacteroides abscessus subsp. abscessus]|nr:Uncharacterised protein [Mycobacteroides abscessus subsp. abscessus]